MIDLTQILPLTIILCMCIWAIYILIKDHNKIILRGRNKA